MTSFYSIWYLRYFGIVISCILLWTCIHLLFVFCLTLWYYPSWLGTILTISYIYSAHVPNNVPWIPNVNFPMCRFYSTVPNPTNTPVTLASDGVNDGQPMRFLIKMEWSPAGHQYSSGGDWGHRTHRWGSSVVKKCMHGLRTSVAHRIPHSWIMWLLASADEDRCRGIAHTTDDHRLPPIYGHRPGNVT